jgi:type I restriction enzyme S subunit
MSEWEITSLDQLVESGAVQLTRGKIISKVDTEAYPGVFPVYSSAKDNDGKFGEYGKYMFDEELITWSVDGGGRLFHRLRHKFSVTNVGGVLRILDRGRIDYRFLFYALTLRHSEIRFDWVKKAHPSIIRKLYLNIPLPAISEQRRIVAILDEAFESIATAKAHAEKNLRNAREVFESHLQSFFDDAEAARWPRRTLREVGSEFGRGKSKHRPRNDPILYGGPYPFIQTGDVRGSNHLIMEYTQTYSEAGLAQSKLWPKGTLCITIAANIAETGVLGFDACFPDSVIGLVVHEGQTSSKYIEYMLGTFKAALKAKGKGSAQDNINLGTFENERFPFPDLKTQSEIVRTLDDISTQASRLEELFERKLAALDELKQSLLQQAFSGAL